MRLSLSIRPESGVRALTVDDIPDHPMICSLRFCEHAVAARRVSRRHFLLQHVPVFDHFAVFDAKDIDGDHRLWSPARITTMDHHEITICDGHAWFIDEGCESWNHFCNC